LRIRNGVVRGEKRLNLLDGVVFDQRTKIRILLLHQILKNEKRERRKRTNSEKTARIEDQERESIPSGRVDREGEGAEKRLHRKLCPKRSVGKFPSFSLSRPPATLQPTLR
jgi:hypothetical protein